MNQGKRRAFNVDEYYRLLDVGILPEDPSVELIEGDIIEQKDPTTLQASCTMRVHALFAELGLYETAIISVRHPVRLSKYSEPIPEVSLLIRREDFYSHGHPTPADVFLLVEIADTEVAYDREVKLPLYAKAGIAYLWLISVRERMIDIYNEPVNGIYREFRKVTRDESFLFPLLPGQHLTGKMILG